MKGLCCLCREVAKVNRRSDSEVEREKKKKSVVTLSDESFWVMADHTPRGSELLCEGVGTVPKILING